MTRRSPFQEGEGWFPWDSHSNLLPPHSQMGDGLPRDHLLNAWLLLMLMWMWGVWSTLASGLCLGTLRINTFSNEAMPGKTEVSFEPRYHKVQCMKDHYPESVVWESIVRSLKGAVADMARYMGPTASVSDILHKLMVILWMVALFDVLMQNFYKVLLKGTMKKCPLLPQG